MVRQGDQGRAADPLSLPRGFDRAWAARGQLWIPHLQQLKFYLGQKGSDQVVRLLSARGWQCPPSSAALSRHRGHLLSSPARRPPRTLRGERPRPPPGASHGDTEAAWCLPPAPRPLGVSGAGTTGQVAVARRTAGRRFWARRASDRRRLAAGATPDRPHRGTE